MRSRRTIALAGVCALALTVGGLLPGAHGEEKAPGRTVAEAVDAYLQPLVESGLFSGSVLLAKGGKVLVDKAYGHADIARRSANTPTTRHKLMSTTKSITAVAILRLLQAGKLAIEDPVAKHLNGWPEGWAGVRIKNLLDHTSGLPNLEPAWGAAARQSGKRGLALWRDLAMTWKDMKLEATVGSRHRYSNGNYELLGAVLEAVSGRSYADVVRTEVFKPAGMTESGFDDGSRRKRLAQGYFRGKGGVPDPRGQDMSVIQAAGGIFSTTRDLYRFDRALQSDKLLSAALKTRMHTAAENTYGYALGWKVWPIQDQVCARHSGGANGYVADLLRFHQDDACVVVLSNFAFAPSLLISDALAAILFERDVDTPERLSKKVLDRYTGIYRGPQSTIVVRRSGDCLALFDVKKGAGRAVPKLLIALGDHRFQRQAWPTLMRFELEKGKPARLRMEGPQPLVFAALEPTDKTWKQAKGSYADQGGLSYRIDVTEGELWLRMPAGWGRDLQLVPVTEDVALTLYGEDFATTLTIVRDAKKAIRGFRWTRNDHRVIVCNRR